MAKRRGVERLEISATLVFLEQTLLPFFREALMPYKFGVNVAAARTSAEAQQ